MVIPVPEFPEKVPVYKLDTPDITAEFSAGIGAKLGLPGEVYVAKDGTYYMGDGEKGRHLEIDSQTAIIRYYTDDFMESTARPLISDEQAAAIATDFLTGCGLLPEGVKAGGIDYAGRNGALFCVSFDYPPGIQIEGFGGSFHVSIGRGIKVVEMTINPRTYQAGEDVALKPVSQAYRELKETGRRYTGGMAQWVKIESVSIAYWLDARENQDVVYPVYVFGGRSGEFFGDWSGLFTGWVEAIDGISISFPVVS